MRFFLLPLLLFTGYFTCAQQTSPPAEKKFTAQQLLTDFDVLTAAIQTHHPSPYRYITSDSLALYASHIKNRIHDSLTEHEFHLLVREYILQVRCGHTVARPSKSWYAIQAAHSLPFPFEVLLYDNRIIIRQSNSEELTLKPGTEILTIDSIPAKTIIAQMNAIQSRDGFGTSFVNHSVQNLFHTYLYFLYGTKNTYHISWKNKDGETGAASVKGIKKRTPVKTTAPDSVLFKHQFSSAWSSLYLAKEKNLALLDINSFGSKKRKKYYRNVFRTLEKNKIQHLAIDLRDNGGGYFPNGMRLLRYFSRETFSFSFNRSRTKLKKSRYARMNFISRLTKTLFRLAQDPVKKNGIRDYRIRYKPIKKNHFNGRVYVLTNGGSFSMSGHTAAFLKHKVNATMIGEETGGAEEGSRAILNHQLVLPQTQIIVYIPYYNLDHQIPAASHGRGIMPDITTYHSINDHLENTDRDIEALLNAVSH